MFLKQEKTPYTNKYLVFFSGWREIQSIMDSNREGKYQVSVSRFMSHKKEIFLVNFFWKRGTYYRLYFLMGGHFPDPKLETWMDSNREGKSQGTRNTVSGFMSHKMEIFLAMRTWIVQKMVLWSFQGEHRLHTSEL